tara:strand:- start:277 stop:1479 length:1203 start_codon:yes stop_codon:yes gene_type:complete
MKKNIPSLDKKITAELKLLAILSHPRLNDLQALQALQASQLINLIDFKVFQKLVNHHRVWSCVYCNLKEHLPFSLPEELRNELKIKYLKNIRKSQNQLNTCSQLLRSFKDNNVEAKVLKGLPLSFKLYGDITKRHSSDLDLVINRKDLIAAHKVLNDLGFQSKEYEQLTNKQKKLYFISHKDIIYFNNTGLMLELHIKLSAFKIELTDHYIYSLFNEKLYTNDKHLELLYLCWHGIHTLFHRLKWVVDIALYLEILDDQDLCHLINKAEENNAMRVLTSSWVLCNILFDTPLNERISKFYQQDLISRILVSRSINQLNQPKSVDSLRFKIDRFCCEPIIYQNNVEKIASVIQKFKPTMLDFTSMPVLPTQLFFLYYPLRPFLFLYRRLANTEFFKSLKAK